MSGRWRIPDAGKTTTIQNIHTNKFLTVNSETAGSAVESMDATGVEQEWERSPTDSSGYFTLKNPYSGRFLTATHPNNSLTIEGRGWIKKK